MSRLFYLFVLQLVAMPLLCQSSPSRGQRNFPKVPDEVVQSLYRQVVAHQPLGIPAGADGKIFEPYLSKALLRRIKLTRSCQNDWLRKNQGHVSINQVPEKAPFAWAELGFFSGDQELSEPSSFKIEKTESKPDGSFRVYVRLTENPSNGNPWSWDVAVQMKMEKQPVVSDVIYLKGDDMYTESRLSEILKEGCGGARWIGDNK